MAVSSEFRQEIRKALDNKTTWIDYRKYRENVEWFKKNFDDLKKNYRGQIVVVLNGEIQVSDKHIDNVRNQLRSVPNLNQAYIRYIPKKKEMLLL